MKPLFPVVLLLAAGLAGCADSSLPPAVSAGTCSGQARSAFHVAASHTVVGIATDKGCMVAELYDDRAPATVANFKTYVNEGFYSDLIFHRVLAQFVSQTGGTKAGGGEKVPTHPSIKDEAIASGLHNYQYTLAMARSSVDSATTQFFINAANNTAGNGNNLDPGGVSKDGYAVFGMLVGGRNVADKINAAPVKLCPSGERACPDPAIVLQAVVVLP